MTKTKIFKIACCSALLFGKMHLNRFRNHWLNREYEKKRAAPQLLYKNWQTPRPPSELYSTARDSVVCGWCIQHTGPGPLRITLPVTHTNSKLTFWGVQIQIFNYPVLHPPDKKTTRVSGRLSSLGEGVGALTPGGVAPPSSSSSTTTSSLALCFVDLPPLRQYSCGHCVVSSRTLWGCS